MNKFFVGVIIAAIVSIIVMSAITPARAEDKNTVGVVYASWSATCRNLRPIAREVAQDYNYSYIEYDIDVPDTQLKLNKVKVAMPVQTPFVFVLKNGAIVFEKAYSEVSPDELRDDLKKVLAP